MSQVAMQKFLDGMCFSPENGPNAALEILEANEKEDLAVVELFDPEYDAANKTLKYNVSIIEQLDLSYASFNERADKTLPETFGPAALFIDDCADSVENCCDDAECCYYMANCNDCETYKTGCCWSSAGCVGCHSPDYYKKKCEERFGKRFTKCMYPECDHLD
jgi:hypothetical protein